MRIAPDCPIYLASTAAPPPPRGPRREPAPSPESRSNPWRPPSALGLGRLIDLIV